MESTKLSFGDSLKVAVEQARLMERRNREKIMDSIRERNSKKDRSLKTEPKSVENRFVLIVKGVPVTVDEKTLADELGEVWRQVCVYIKSTRLLHTAVKPRYDGYTPHTYTLWSIVVSTTAETMMALSKISEIKFPDIKRKSTIRIVKISDANNVLIYREREFRWPTLTRTRKGTNRNEAPSSKNEESDSGNEANSKATKKTKGSRSFITKTENNIQKRTKENETLLPKNEDIKTKNEALSNGMMKNEGSLGSTTQAEDFFQKNNNNKDKNEALYMRNEYTNTQNEGKNEGTEKNGSFLSSIIQEDESEHQTDEDAAEDTPLFMPESDVSFLTDEFGNDGPLYTSESNRKEPENEGERRINDKWIVVPQVEAARSPPDMYQHETRQFRPTLNQIEAMNSVKTGEVEERTIPKQNEDPMTVFEKLAESELHSATLDETDKSFMAENNEEEYEHSCHEVLVEALKLQATMLRDKLMSLTFIPATLPTMINLCTVIDSANNEMVEIISQGHQRCDLNSGQASTCRRNIAKATKLMKTTNELYTK